MDLGYRNFTEIYINAWWPTLVEAKVHTWIYEKCSTIMGCIAITRRYNKWYGQQEYESIQLTGWWLTYPSEKYEFVSWDDEIPYGMEKLKTCSKPPTSYTWSIGVTARLCCFTPCLWTQVKAMRSTNDLTGMMEMCGNVRVTTSQTNCLLYIIMCIHFCIYLFMYLFVSCWWSIIITYIYIVLYSNYYYSYSIYYSVAHPAQ